MSANRLTKEQRIIIDTILYRPTYRAERYNVFTYRYIKAQLNDKEELIRKLVKELQEDREELQKVHSDHVITINKNRESKK